MEHTIFLAQLIGIYALVMGVSMIANPTMLREIFQRITSDRVLSYIMGVIMLILGLLLILSHHNFASSAAALITFLGGIVFLESLFFIFAPARAFSRYIGSMQNNSVYYGIAAAYLIIGVYLTYIGFLIRL